MRNKCGWKYRLLACYYLVYLCIMGSTVTAYKGGRRILNAWEGKGQLAPGRGGFPFGTQ